VIDGEGFMAFQHANSGYLMPKMV